MEFDTKSMDANGLKYLAALYEIVSERVKGSNDPDALICTSGRETVIGEHAGLAPQDADQAINYLFDYCLVNGESAEGDQGRSICMTPAGCRLAHQYLEERSPAARRRRTMSAVGDVVRDTSKEAGKHILLYLGGAIFIGFGGWWNRHAIIQWVRSHLGL